MKNCNAYYYVIVIDFVSNFLSYQKTFSEADQKKDIKDEIALTLEILKKLAKPKPPKLKGNYCMVKKHF